MNCRQGMAYSTITVCPVSTYSSLIGLHTNFRTGRVRFVNFLGRPSHLRRLNNINSGGPVTNIMLRQVAPLQTKVVRPDVVRV